MEFKVALTDPNEVWWAEHLYKLLPEPRQINGPCVNYLVESDGSLSFETPREETITSLVLKGAQGEWTCSKCGSLEGEPGKNEEGSAVCPSCEGFAGITGIWLSTRSSWVDEAVGGKIRLTFTGSLPCVANDAVIQVTFVDGMIKVECWSEASVAEMRVLTGRILDALVRAGDPEGCEAASASAGSTP